MGVAIVAAYKKAFTDNGGDKSRVCAALGLDESSWPEVGGVEAFLAQYLKRVPAAGGDVEPSSAAFTQMDASNAQARRWQAYMDASNADGCLQRAGAHTGCGHSR